MRTLVEVLIHGLAYGTVLVPVAVLAWGRWGWVVHLLFSREKEEERQLWFLTMRLRVMRSLVRAIGEAEGDLSGAERRAKAAGGGGEAGQAESG